MLASNDCSIIVYSLSATSRGTLAVVPPRPRSYDETAHRRAFGSRVRELRQERGLSQEDLAERSGLHRTYVVNVENGHRNVSLDTICQIAAGLSVLPQELFRWDATED